MPAQERNTTGLDLLDASFLIGREGPSIELTLNRRPETTFGHMLATRRSVRPDEPCSLSDIIDLLWYLHLPTTSWIADDGYRERQMPAPSAGGRHPLSLLVVATSLTDSPPGVWAISPADKPVLVPVEIPAETIGKILAAAATALRASEPPPVLLVAVARSARTLSKYPWGKSLIWRDAGALLNTAHLVAHDLDLDSCLVGISETVCIPLPNTDEQLYDVGALAVGGRTTNATAED